MPMLPSGRHIALSPKPLVELLENASAPGNVHKVMALKDWPDLYPWIDVIYLVPEGSPGARDKGEFSDNSLPRPPGWVPIKAGYRLCDWESHARDWSEEDRVAFSEVLDGRAREHYAQHLDYARGLQERLLASAGGVVPQILAWWYKEGVHPSQQEGWKEGDSIVPCEPAVWDTYDLVAALLASLGALNDPEVKDGIDWRVCARLQGVLPLFLQELGPPPEDVSGISDLAAAWRQRRALEALPEDRCGWFRNQAIIECTNLWNLAGDTLKLCCPEAYELIELVALSPEGAACM